MAKALEEWFFKTSAWEECLKTFDEWDSRVRCYLATGEEFQPFCRPEFSDIEDDGSDAATEEGDFVYADELTEDCVTRLHAVSGLDPTPIWETYLLIAERAPGEEIRHAHRRTELLYLLAWQAGRTTARPDANAKAHRGVGRPKDPAVAWRRDQVRRIRECGNPALGEIVERLLQLPNPLGAKINPELVRKDVEAVKAEGHASMRTTT